MGTSIRNIFTFNKKSHRQQQKRQDMSRQSSLSPTSSVASFSTMSTSGPQTPTTPSEQDVRGIFRTLEPCWSFYHPQQHYWYPFDTNQTAMLEQRYQEGRANWVELAYMGGGSCTVHFQQPKSSLSPSLSSLSSNGVHFIMGQTLHRTVVPVWWFEQGNSHMARFEEKNQIRLETLSEDRTHLTLVDVGLENASTTVVLSTTTTPGQEEEEEEMRGLLYVHHSHHPMDSLGQKLQDLYQPSINDSYDMTTLLRRGSI